MWRFLHRWASPPSFYKFSMRLIPGITVIMCLLLTYGLIGGLYFAPADYQQGDAFRMIYIHVPAAFLSLFIYSAMAIAACISLIWQIKLADIFTSESAPLGAWFTFLALLSGAVWGKPMWGTWWIWDARLTSELILLFLYFGFIALRSALPDDRDGARAGNVLLLIGVVNIPIIHYSVYWWNTLHQGATLQLFGRSLIAPSMLYPLIAMIAGFIFYYFVVLFQRMSSEIIWRERKSTWVKNLLKDQQEDMK